MNEPTSSSASPIVYALDVHKSYRDGSGSAPHEVLSGVSLEIDAGRFVALMGASGSGKTTLLNLFGGLDIPESGAVHLCGRELQKLTDDERSEFRLRNVGFVFQFFNLLQNLTVMENIALPMLLLGDREKDTREAARRMAAEVGLEDKLARLANQLSGGEMQRVAIARAMAHQPRLLLADEPTGNLDSKTGHTILELIRRVATAHGVTVLMATHDPKTADYCDDTVYMADGRIVKELP